ncbi:MULTISPECIES: hypothetical protein [unclassified Campylobacter]|uniref:hypothetical protein n=1 Tax=unclassified Campylobacter TaxID=2593542 RepID=UPI0022E9D789|nr:MULTISPECIES: hypothetical protein [unclassified Campylobacter]MDA3055224.1 hypothetical protein [Campylobacter sp. VBCF_07 NA4]MDA3061476.1 hypothetical protein [Campylobacter sp. VBCF_02 NA5]MDA3070993.1 hypothetical protein [Campylobacter sp. VBCF_08 NA3]WBR53927.1 hypothetical protein PF027_06250 [Campylobacter sp. VBCF_01 NA2]
MKKEKVFSRALSAMLILFGVSVGAFADDDELYDGYASNIKYFKPTASVGVDPEIPNSGEIPSDFLGEYSGTITYGGSGLNNLKPWGGLAPKNPDGSDNVWYDENGKKQFINFSNLDPLNPQSQKLSKRFGGEGTYVFGDIVTAGAPVIKPMPGDTMTSSGTDVYDGDFFDDGGIGDTFNSSKNEIKLPKGVTKDDIVMARLYWFGHLYNNNDIDSDEKLDSKLDDSYGPENCTQAELDEVAKRKREGKLHRDASCKRLPTTLKIKALKGYQDVKLKVGNSSAYNVQREICEGIFAYNSSKNAQDGQDQRYDMKYSCSADITSFVKSNFKDYSESIDIAVGNVNATGRSPHYNSKGNQVWRMIEAYNGGSIDAGFFGGTARLLPFGGWYVVLVYDKNLESQQQLLDNPDKIGASDKKSAQQYIDRFFRPKNVTLYDGYLYMEPSASGVSNEEQALAKSVYADFTLSGFYTPKNGDVQGKLVFASFGANRGPTTGAKEGLFVAKEGEDLYSNKLPSSVYHPNSFFNGSRTWLELDDSGDYTLQGRSGTAGYYNKGYHQGFDLDEFDISKKSTKILDNNQSSLAVRVGLTPFKPQDAKTYESNRAYVQFVGVSVDLYVPQLCYEQKMYDTAGWLGFYNEDGTPKNKIGTVEDVTVVTGENLYYRTEIRNKDDKDSEDASGAWVHVDTGRSNTYTPNSSGINNVPVTGASLDGIKEFKFLQDNTPGAYSTQAKRAAGGTPDVTDTVYAGKQLNSLRDNQLKFYVGRGAGSLVGNEPVGGELKKGESIFLEYNATVGRTFTYTPIRYTMGYTMNLAGQAVVGPTAIMSRCDSEESDVKIVLLNGLKVVNQNFKDYGDSESDKNKTLAQDDRLFTQIAGKEFKVNMIFKPDINDIFDEYCVSRDTDGKCKYKSDDFDLCENYAGIFLPADEKGECRARVYKKIGNVWGVCMPGNDPDGCSTGELDGSLQYFPLPGDLYLSAIRTGSGCKYITDNDKLPFKVNGKDERLFNYKTGFKEEQEKSKKKVVPLEKIEFEDAFGGVTFMFSYRPRGLTLNNDFDKLDMNATALYNYNPVDNPNAEAELITNSTEYYKRYQIESLYQKYIDKDANIPDSVRAILDEYNLDRFRIRLSEYRARTVEEAQAKKRRLELAWLAGTMTGNTPSEERAEFEKEKNAVVAELDSARSYFGTEMSPDGSFHVCDSDHFVIRPAYFEVDMAKTSKYAKLVDPDKDGDITEALVDSPTSDLRVGGKYSDNDDVLTEVFYARSYKGNPVPNYNAVLGGNLGEKRFAQRNSYTIKSLSVDEANANVAFREQKTYLKPFISNDCYGVVSGQAYYVEKELQDRTGVKSTLGTECNTRSLYSGFKFEDGKYTIDDLTMLVKKQKETDEIDNDFGKIDTGCKVNGKDFYTNYDKIWDKDAISLLADFGVKSVNLSEGAAKIESRFGTNDLIVQGKLAPNEKADVAAVLTTETLYSDASKSSLKGQIFNYYNVGDVLVNVYDNSWTDKNGDQTYDERKDGDDKYWGTKCIIDSATNKPDSTGRVGCDISIKRAEKKDSNESLGLVLRYKPDRIEISSIGLQNGLNGAGWKFVEDGELKNASSYDANASVLAGNYTNGVASNLNQTRFTYFNSVEVEDDVTIDYYGDNNVTITLADSDKNKAVTSQLSELAMIKANAKVYLSDEVYSDVIATLYDGRAYEAESGKAMQPLCGFASDMELSVGFDYDCATNSTDARCIKGQTALTTPSEIDYKPYPDKPNFEVKIPSGTQYFNDDVCIASANYDSRCYKFNTKSQGAAGTRSEDATDRKAFPLSAAISFYTDKSLNSGFIHKKDSNGNKTGVYLNPKQPDFILMSRAFKEGQTPSATIFFNFDRMQKSPHLPLVIYPTDFSLSNFKFIDDKASMLPAKFKKDYATIPYATTEISSAKQPMGGVREMKVENFADYAKSLGGVAALPSGTGTYAYFIYGKSYDVDNGSAIKRPSVKTNEKIDIKEALYCPKSEGDCSTLLAPNTTYELLKPSSNIFKALKDANEYETMGGGFVINKLSTIDASNIADVFVSRYATSKATIIPSGKNNGEKFKDGVQTISVTSATRGSDTIRILTNPWLIYTPDNGVHGYKVYIDDAPSDSEYAYRYSGVRQYYNPIEVRFRLDGTWGGEGTIKGGEDNVGNFVGGNDTSASGDSVESNDEGRSYRNNRINW